ncbi:hypothetical protein HK104_009325 [Borealophlyctis nickersoniae]|nr:hypothetical protein HK104_009325 [Borealophlyctis nickersoniae]
MANVPGTSVPGTNLPRTNVTDTSSASTTILNTLLKKFSSDQNWTKLHENWTQLQTECLEWVDTREEAAFERGKPVGRKQAEREAKERENSLRAEKNEALRQMEANKTVRRDMYWYNNLFIEAVAANQACSPKELANLTCEFSLREFPSTPPQTHGTYQPVPPVSL